MQSLLYKIRKALVSSGMSQQNYSWKVKNNSFSYLDLIRLFDALKLPDEEILGRMKL